jgi:hypothetical protein
LVSLQTIPPDKRTFSPCAIAGTLTVNHRERSEDFAALIALQVIGALA